MANLIRLRKAHRGSRESGVGVRTLNVPYQYQKPYKLFAQVYYYLLSTTYSPHLPISPSPHLPKLPTLLPLFPIPCSLFPFTINPIFKSDLKTLYSYDLSSN
ncbi:MAG: hypothetical protein F6K26_48895 [Moorea sp. SIO2I5]|nr:hypothetical protein [Moorena sp. SIO2I5]